MRKLKFLKLHWAKLLSVFFLILLLGAYAHIFAIDRKYNPGEILNPDCFPGETNCTVDITTGSSQWTTNGSSIYYNTGNVGVGVIAPTAQLQFKAGTTTAGTAPLKFTVGTNLTNAEAGAMEWNGTNLFITQTSGPTRKTIAYTTDISDSSPITIVDSTNLVSTGLQAAGPVPYGTQDAIIIGRWAGFNMISGYNSIFLGLEAGAQANAESSNFIGHGAGSGTTSQYSNFLGHFAGENSTSANYSNFIGSDAGASTSATFSNFIGFVAGRDATSASYSNFFGSSAGSSAANASNSNFFGAGAGANATNASYSNLIGFRAGLSPISINNSIGANNIIIGTNISLPTATANSMNLGGVLFATGTYATTTGNPSTTAVATGKVGVGVVSPSARLQLAAGTASAGTAPLKLTAGTNLGTTEAGAIEYDGSHLYFSATNNGDRYQLDQQADGIVSSPWLANGSDIYYDGGNVGIGNDSPTSKLDIKLDLTVSYNQSFSGSGLNDAIYSGTYSGSNPPNAVIVQIDGEGTPDTFTYYDNHSDCSYPNGFSIPITGSAQLVCDGISITFTNITGHHSGDTWTYEINSPDSNPIIKISDNTGNNYFTVNAVADKSNFLGTNAGNGAVSAHDSNFIGTSAGNGAVSAHDSNFIGTSAGYGATSASGSNFLGLNAGIYATGAHNSNFLGPSAGNGATSAIFSNFIGTVAGLSATSSSYSNFIGNGAGYQATSASYSNFLGINAGNGATSAINSNFLGPWAGSGAINVSYSNLFGYETGMSFTGNNIGSNNIILGTSISLPNAATNAINLGGVIFATGTHSDTNGISIIAEATGKVGIGVVSPSARLQLAAGTASAGTAPLKLTAGTNLSTTEAGAIEYDGSHLYFSATNSGSRYQLDQQGGTPSPITIVNTSNLFSTGISAGTGVTSTTDSNFFGTDAGDSATGAFGSNFFGPSAGISAPDAFYSNFFGLQAGAGANDASNSNFLGHNAGASAINAALSNFLGQSAGLGAVGASESNFIGDSAGYQATSAHDSNFLGNAAGQGASLASYSNLFGYQSGRSFPVDTPTNNIGSNNIIIGTNISLPNATANTMNLGGVLFATGTYATTTGDPSITAVSGGKVGIGVVSPSYTLQVGNSSISGVVARFENSVGTCDINPTTSSVGCSSDIRLKKNITTLDNTEFALSTVPDMTGKSTLEKVLNLTPVTYNWNSESDTDQKHIGFIAQEMEQIFPDLVSTDPVTGLKSLSYANMTPYLAKAIQEMDLKITDINNQELENSWRDSILAWFKNTSNGITEFVSSILRAKDKLCIGEGSDEVCITKEDLLQMKNNAGLNAGTAAVLPTVDNSGSSGTDNSTAGTSDTSGTGASNTGTTTDTTGTTGGNDGNNTDTTGGNTNNTTTDTSTTNTPDTGTTNINAGNDTTGNASGDTTNTDTTNTNNNNSGTDNQNNDLGN